MLICGLSPFNGWAQETCGPGLSLNGFGSRGEYQLGIWAARSLILGWQWGGQIWG